jgi:hypothetical protein
MRLAYANGYGDADSHSDCDGHGDSNSNGHSNSNSNGHNNSNANGNCHCDSNGNAHVYSDAEGYTDAEAASDAAASSVVRGAKSEPLRPGLARETREFSGWGGSASPKTRQRRKNVGRGGRMCSQRVPPLRI